jgi:hypothetical protein
MKKYLLLVLCLLTSTVLAQGPDLGIPAELRPSGQYVTLQPKTEAKAITYIGLSGVDPLPSTFLKDARWFLLDTRGLPAGRYLFTAVGSLDDEHTRSDFAVLIGDAPGPVPPGPQPPGPGPGPGPDPVVPDGKPSVVGEGFRVLIVEENADRAKLPASQLYAMLGTELTNYLNSKCAKDETGKADWHIWDDDFTDTQIQTLPPRWQQPYKDAVLYAHGLKPLDNGGMPPVIIVSNTLSKLKPPGVLVKLPPASGIMPLVRKYGDVAP